MHQINKSINHTSCSSLIYKSHKPLWRCPRTLKPAVRKVLSSNLWTRKVTLSCFFQITSTIKIKQNISWKKVHSCALSRLNYCKWNTTLSPPNTSKRSSEASYWYRRHHIIPILWLQVHFRFSYSCLKPSSRNSDPLYNLLHIVRKSPTWGSGGASPIRSPWLSKTCLSR